MSMRLYDDRAGGFFQFHWVLSRYDLPETVLRDGIPTLPPEKEGCPKSM